MHTSFAIDQANATSKDHSVSALMKQFTYGTALEEWVTVKAHNGYENAIQHPYGHNISWTSKRDDMGVHIRFSGRSLKELTDTGVDTIAIVIWLSEEGFKFTRLDLAIDIFGVKIDLEELQRCKWAGSVNKLPQLIKDGPNCEEGSTMYVGSRDSEKFFRIYDKAGEQGEYGGIWTRAELELHSRTATKIAARIVTMTVEEVAKLTGGIILGMYNPEHKDFQQAMNSTPEKVGSTKDSSHSTYDWIMATVSKSIAKTIIELPHRDVWESLEKEVFKHIREMAARNAVSSKGDELDKREK